MATKLVLSVKLDAIFRLFFGDERNLEFLTGLLQSILDIPPEDYDEVEILDPHLLREHVGDKLGIIDLKIKTKSKKIVHVEVQRTIPLEIRERLIYYAAKLITEQVGIGDDYDKIMRVISIIIAEEEMIPDSSRYHHRFRLSDLKAGVEYTDLIEINVVELSKLPQESDGTSLCDWAKFIAAETEEELSMAAETNVQIGRAVVKLRELSADERARDLAERREKALRDERSRLRGAKLEGRNEGRVEGIEVGRTEGIRDVARNALDMNMSVEAIAMLTCLSVTEIEEIRAQQQTKQG